MRPNTNNDYFALKTGNHRDVKLALSPFVHVSGVNNNTDASASVSLIIDPEQTIEIHDYVLDNFYEAATKGMLAIQRKLQVISDNYTERKKSEFDDKMTDHQRYCYFLETQKKDRHELHELLTEELMNPYCDAYYRNSSGMWNLYSYGITINTGGVKEERTVRIIAESTYNMAAVKKCVSQALRTSSFKGADGMPARIRPLLKESTIESIHPDNFSKMYNCKKILELIMTVDYKTHPYHYWSAKNFMKFVPYKKYEDIQWSWNKDVASILQDVRHAVALVISKFKSDQRAVSREPDLFNTTHKDLYKDMYHLMNFFLLGIRLVTEKPHDEELIDEICQWMVPNTDPDTEIVEPNLAQEREGWRQKIETLLIDNKNKLEDPNFMKFLIELKNQVLDCLRLEIKFGTKEFCEDWEGAVDQTLQKHNGERPKLFTPPGYRLANDKRTINDRFKTNMDLERAFPTEYQRSRNAYPGY